MPIDSQPNRQAIDALAQAIADGGCSALFPEGTSHDDPHPAVIKSGAAYLYYRAVEFDHRGRGPTSCHPSWAALQRQEALWLSASGGDSSTAGDSRRPRGALDRRGEEADTSEALDGGV